MTAGIVQLLKDGRLDDASQLKIVEEYLSYNIDALNTQIQQDRPTSGPKINVIQKKFRLEADKDWQDTGIILPPGTQVTVRAEGRWAPGNRSSARSSVKDKKEDNTIVPGQANPPAVRDDSDSDRYKLADADAYNFELKLQAKNNVSAGGISWTFSSGDGGSLSGRMKDYSAQTRSTAKGAVNVTISWEELKREPSGDAKKQTEPLEVILARYLPDGGKKLFGTSFAPLVDAKAASSTKSAEQKSDSPAGGSKAAAAAGKSADEATGKAKLHKKVYRLKVRADKDWQIFPIEIMTGDKLLITASGTWTPDQPTKEPAGAETFNYSLKIASLDSVNGGAEYAMTATATGKILLRISCREWIVTSKAKPAGELELTLTLEREGEEIR